MINALIMMFVSMIGMIVLPFIGILLFLKVRRQRKINKATKVAIKDGEWESKFEYHINKKTKQKLNKIVIKGQKKFDKNVTKMFNTINKGLKNIDWINTDISKEKLIEIFETLDEITSKLTKDE